jgi:hypothetical protein
MHRVNDGEHIDWLCSSKENILLILSINEAWQPLFETLSVRIPCRSGVLLLRRPHDFTRSYCTAQSRQPIAVDVVHPLHAVALVLETSKVRLMYCLGCV